MVEFNPRPLFGKHSYVVEEIILNHYANAVEKALFWANPKLINMDQPFRAIINLKSPESRKRKIRDNLERAKKFLHDLGVQ